METKEFNSGQLEAISHGSGPMLVLAGPGSGKTTVITYRIKYLIENYGIDGSNILVITYTRAAAGEMSERFDKLMAGTGKVTFGTFHSVFFMMLRKAYGYTGKNIVKEQEKYEFIRNIIEEYDMNYDGQDDFAKNIISEISCVKSEMQDIEDHFSTNMKPADFKIVYTKYNEWLRKKNKLDFDDMLIFAYELLSTCPDVRKLWQEKFKYILIDEFQDINYIQYEIVKLLLSEDENFFAVGDDDQSVYSFRGADTKLMLDLPGDFPNLKIISLNINYRCNKFIVDASKHVIGNNKMRYDKEIISGSPLGETGFIRAVNTENTTEEYEDIAKKIRELNNGGVPYSKIAVIYRTNFEPAGLTIKLVKYNVPFKIKDSVPDILNHFTSINILDYVSLAIGNRDRKRFLRIINRPNRYISRESLKNETVDFDELKKYYADNRRVLKNITDLENSLNRIKVLKPFPAVNYIRKFVGYDDYIKEYADYCKIEPREYLEILDEFQELAKESDNFKEWFASLEAYKEKTKENICNNDKASEAVTLATMHSAKGLEFDYVFIMNGVEGVTPHKKSVTEKEIEEERRMFYVAVTRARSGLTIYIPEVIYGKKGRRSRFIDEMELS